jgi:hypothetical protein
MACGVTGPHGQLAVLPVDKAINGDSGFATTRHPRMAVTLVKKPQQLKRCLVPLLIVQVRFK